MSSVIRIGAGNRQPALWEAEFLRQELAGQQIESELVIIEDEAAGVDHDRLLRGEFDVVVHPLNSLPTSLPPDLVVTAVSRREDPADWLVVRRDVLAARQLFQLPATAAIGVTSTRRIVQILDFRPDLEVRPVHGNLFARLEKLKAGKADAILLDAAALIRLQVDLSDYHVVRFNPREFVPAPGQGVLAYLTCADDRPTRRLLKKVHHPEVSALTNVERRVLQLLGGDPQLPLGVYCERDPAGNYHVWAAVGGEADHALRRARLSQSTSHQLAERVAEQLQTPSPKGN